MSSVFDPYSCQLGEGPAGDLETNRIWWFDIEGSVLFEHDEADGITTQIPLPKMASMMGTVDDHHDLMAMEDGLYLRNRTAGTLALHCALEADLPDNRSNDGRVHQSGALWIGTMGKSMQHKAGAIYWFFKGELKKLYEDITVPNAICFSPNGDIAYFTDTHTRKLMRVGIDPTNGLPTGEPEVFYEHKDHDGWQDGAVVDCDGVIWNACWGGNCVLAISPEGELIKTIPVPALQVSCPAFVGEAMNKLLVTTAWSGMSDATRQKDPDGGKTFLLDIDVKGRAEPRIVL